MQTRFMVLSLTAWAAVATLDAKTVYVNCKLGDYTGHDGSTPEKALRTIAEATDDGGKAAAGDTVEVAAGVYNEGYSDPTTWWGKTRIHVVNKRLYIHAPEGPEKTVIEGKRSAETAYGYGTDAIRCATFQGATAAESIIEGFTLRNGATYDQTNIGGSGGAVCASETGSLPHSGGPYLVGCIVENCTSPRAAVSYGGTFVRCLIRGNTVQPGKYFSYQSTFVNSVISRTTADSGTSYGTAHFDQSKAVNCTFVDNYASFYPTTTSYVYNNIISFSQMPVGGSSGYNAGNFTDSAAVMALVSPVLGDVRIRTGVTAVQTGDAQYLGSGYLSLPSGAAPFTIDPYVDYYGNAIPATGTIAAGACQATAAPVGGTVKLATDRLVADGSLHFANVYFAPTNYPMSVRVTYRPGTTTRVIQYNSNYNATNYRQCPLLGDEDPVDVIPPSSGASGVLTVSVGTSSSNIVWADPEADAATADGSEEKPYPTIQGALDAAVAVSATGIIRCKKGTYKPGADNEGVSSFSFNSTSGYTMLNLPQSKTYRFIAEEGPEKTFIMGKADPSTGTYGTNAVNFAAGFGLGFVQGFTITGCYSSTDGNGGFWSTGRGIYYTYGNDFEVHDCVISNNTGSCYIMSVGRCYRCKILNNTSVSGVIGQGNIVASCVIAGNTVSSGVVFDGAAKVYGCSVDGAGVGTAFANDASAVIVNTVVDHGGSAVYANGGHYGCVYNGFTSWAGSNYLKADPYFADVTEGDLRMAWSSEGVAAAVGPGDANANGWRFYAMTDVESKPAQFDSAGRPLPGAYNRAADGVVVAAGQGGVAVTNGKIGLNALDAGDSITISATMGTRPVAGLVVNGVTNLFENLPAHALAWSGADGNAVIEALYLNRWYAATNGSGGASGFYPSEAKTLQGALSNANLASGDTVVAMPGTYDSGTMLSGVEFNARAVVPAGVTLASAEGRDVTFIKGRAADTEDAGSPAGQGLGVGAIRCVHLNSGSKLWGFTVLDGHTRYLVGSTGTDLHSGPETTGGGVGAFGGARINCWVEDCVISNCAAYRGGGAMAVKAKNCVFANNYAYYIGGGASDSKVFGCVSRDNTVTAQGAQSKGFAYSTQVENSTVSDGLAFANAGGICRNNLVPGAYTAGTPSAGNVANCYFNKALLSAYTGDWLAATTACVVTNLNALATDAAGRPIIGANLAIDAADETIMTESLGGTDALGGQRIYNGALDAGALEADWRPVYARDIAKRRLAVVSVSEEVVDDGSGTVKLKGESSVVAEWANPSGNTLEYVVTMRVTGNGTLTVKLNGEMVKEITAATVDPTVTFKNAFATNGLVFDYTPGENDTGFAEILSVKANNGLVLSFR